VLVGSKEESGLGAAPARPRESDQRLSEDDIHYLRSILGHLREVRRIVNLEITDAGFAVSVLGCEVLADNIDWLDCFIERNTR
jgi:hypothetical protein